MERKISFFKKTLFVSAMILGMQAQANFTYEGTLVDSSGSAVTGTVLFKLEVMSPGTEMCVLYSETQTISMSNADGYFSLNVGAGTGSNAYPLNKVFQNQVTFSGLTCNPGTTYQGAVGDGRRMRVTITVGANAPEVLGMINLNSVPMADTARAVGSFEPTSLLRAVDGSGNPVTAPALNPTQLTDFTNLIAGTSNKYLTGSPGSGTQLPSVSGQPGTLNPGTTWFDTTTQQLKYWNGSSAISMSGGPVFGYSDLLTVPANGLNVGGGQLVVQTGNVGIGTPSPMAKLDVNGQIRITGGAPSVGKVLTSDSMGLATWQAPPMQDFPNGGSMMGMPLSIGTNDTQDFSLKSNGVAQVTIKPNGAVGIGTVTPAYPLEVYSGATSSVANFSSPMTGTSYISLTNTGDTPVKLGSQANNFVIRTGTGGSPLERFRIDETGNIGIGTTAPGAPLEIQSSTAEVVRLRSTSGSTVVGFGNGSTIPVRIGAQGNDMVFLMGTSPVEQMRLSASGGLGIGVATPQSRLTVAGAVQVAWDSGSCTPPKMGAIRFDNITTYTLQVCDGAGWRSLSAGAEVTGTSTTADFTQGKTVVLSTASTSISLVGLQMAQHYQLIVEDPTPATHAFTGCAGTYFNPANGTTNGYKTIYKIYVTNANKCYIEWNTFQ